MNMNGLTKPAANVPCPDYLYEPMEEDERIEGSLGRWSVSSSLSTWLDTHPAAKAGLVAATALGVAAALRVKAD